MLMCVLFQVGDRQFGVDMPLVRSIQRAGAFFKEQSGETLGNTLEVDGEEIRICDLPSFLGQNESSHELMRKKVMLMKSREHALALIVDRVDGVISVESEQLAPLPPVFEGPALKCFPRVLALDDDLVLLLEPEGMSEMVAEQSTKTGRH